MKKLLVLILSIIFCVTPLWGCGKVDNNFIKLDYFRADRYTATIVENKPFVFWANSEGLHRKSKETQEISQLLAGKNINYLSVYGDFLYYVIDERELCRININTKAAESIFKLNENYMCQIQDYSVVDEKVFFLNTHSLFYYDIPSRSITELKNITVETLQIVGEDIYFIDHAERTNTVYVFSMSDNFCKPVLGDGKYTPYEKAYMDFRIVNGNIYYTQAMPSGTYVMPLLGEEKIIADGRSTFICESSLSEGLYYMSYGLEESHLYFRDKDGNEEPACFSMKELNAATGVAVVDGYVYYNSGYERVLNDSGHYVYNYGNSKPVMQKIFDREQ